MRIDGEEIYLRTLEIQDTQAMQELQLRNREFFQKYSPAREDSFYTLDSQFEAVKKSIYDMEKGLQYRFGIFMTDSDELIGDIALFHILHDSLQSCLLGYCLDQRYNGRGYMGRAVSMLVTFAFGELKLHRIEAGVMPSNVGSVRVLEKAGFQREGLSVKNVKINGKWEDHLVYAIINCDPGEEQ